MFVIDLLLDDLAKEIKDAPGWLTLIIVCNVLLGSHVVLESVERRGFHIRDEKALIATLAAIVLFLLGDIVDILVFPRRKDAERWEKVLRDIMLTVLISGVFYVVGKEWARRLFDSCHIRGPVGNPFSAIQLSKEPGGTGTETKTEARKTGIEPGRGEEAGLPEAFRKRAARGGTEACRSESQAQGR